MTTTQTTATATATTRIYSDPTESGLAWSADDESGAYGDLIDDPTEALRDLYLSARDDDALVVDWNPNDGGSLTVTGPANHPIFAEAR